MEWQAGEPVVRVPVGETTLDGNLTLPASLIGVVLFAHGSGSSRHSPRNRYVARVLNEAGPAALLVADEQIEAVERIEKAIREKYPSIKRIFIEARRPAASRLNAGHDACARS